MTLWLKQIGIFATNCAKLGSPRSLHVAAVTLQEFPLARLTLSLSDTLKRDKVIREYLNGCTWQVDPRFLLHRSLVLPYGQCRSDWLKYCKAYPYVIEYGYMAYWNGARYSGHFVFANTTLQKLLVVQSSFIQSAIFLYGGRGKTHNRLRRAKRKALTSLAEMLGRYWYNLYPSVVAVQSVAVTESDIQWVNTLARGEPSDFKTAATKTSGKFLDVSDSKRTPESFPTVSESYLQKHFWPCDTTLNTCIERDRILRSYIANYYWSLDPEFNVMRNILVSLDCHNEEWVSYAKAYPYLYDYEYMCPVKNSPVVLKGDFLFTDGNNRFLVAEFKCVQRGVLSYTAHSKTTRNHRNKKRSMGKKQAQRLATYWHEYNEQVVKTEGVFVTDDAVNHVITFER